MNSPVACAKWIASFLFQRQQILRDQECHNRLSFLCSNGIPQGTVLCPFLFSVLVGSLGRDYEGVMKFVDDLTISCTYDEFSLESPQEVFDQIRDESAKIHLPLNIKKCSYICFDFKRQRLPISIVSDEVEINQLSSLNLLGVVIQDNLKWDSHVNNIIRRANAKMYLLYTMRRIGMSRKLMKTVYVASIRSVLEYGSPAWHPSLTKRLIGDLERVQNRVVRIIMGSEYRGRTHALSCLALESLQDRRVKLHASFAIKFLQYFPELCPPSQGDVSGRMTRGSQLYRIPTVGTTRMKNSPIISYLDAVNEYLKTLT